MVGLMRTSSSRGPSRPVSHFVFDWPYTTVLVLDISHSRSRASFIRARSESRSTRAFIGGTLCAIRCAEMDTLCTISAQARGRTLSRRPQQEQMDWDTNAQTASAARAGLQLLRNQLYAWERALALLRGLW
eukprot:6203332-Pleurochrysis_carterae.AAC.3